MKYDNYRENLKAVRKLLYSEDTPDMIGQFGKYVITTGRRNRTVFTAIWNAKTDNIVAMRNAKGNVVVREASIYSGQLLNSKKRKVVKGTKLVDYRGKIPSHFRQNIKLNMIIESALERIKANNDQPNKVLLYKLGNGEINHSSLMDNLRMRINNTQENTRRTLERSNDHVLVETSVDGTRKVYLQIQDYEAEIALERKINAVKIDIVRYLKENYEEFRSESLLSNMGRNNPFTVELEIDGTPYFGSLDGYFMDYLASGRYEIDDVAMQFRLEPDSEGMRAEREHAWGRSTGRTMREYMQMYAYGADSPFGSVSTSNIRPSQTIHYSPSSVWEVDTIQASEVVAPEFSEFYSNEASTMSRAVSENVSRLAREQLENLQF